MDKNGYHNRLRVAAERVHQQFGQHGVTIRHSNVLAARVVRKSADHIAKRRERQIDRCAFFERIARCARLRSLKRTFWTFVMYLSCSTVITCSCHVCKPDRHAHCQPNRLDWWSMSWPSLCQHRSCTFAQSWRLRLCELDYLSRSFSWRQSSDSLSLRPIHSCIFNFDK